MFTRNIFLTLTLLHLSLSCIQDEKNQIDPVTQEKLDLYKEDYKKVSESTEKLTTGRSHSEICFYGALGGVALYASSYFMNKNLADSMGSAGAALCLGSGGIGIVSAVNEQLKLRGCRGEKEKLRSCIDKIEMRHHK